MKNADELEKHADELEKRLAEGDPEVSEDDWRFAANEAQRAKEDAEDRKRRAEILLLAGAQDRLFNRRYEAAHAQRISGPVPISHSITMPRSLRVPRRRP